MSASTRTLAAAAGLTLCAVAMLPGAPGTAQPGSRSTAGSTPRLVVSDAQTDVFAPALSYTGRYVAHLAIRRGQTPAVQQVRRTDLKSGNSVLLNPSIDGGVAVGNYSRPPVISADATRVSYSTDATRLVANDTNNAFDAFVRDVPAHATLLASVAFDGGVANGDVGQASLSKNGRYVVFTSNATDQVPGSTTTNTDVFRRDLTTGTTVQVSVRPDGSPSVGPGSLSTDINLNGNQVAFTSYNTDLGQNEGNDGEADLFVRDMTTNHTRWLSRLFPTGANPFGVVISPNGRWVSTRWDDGSLHLTKAGTGVTTTVTANGYALLGSFSSVQDRFVYVSEGGPFVRNLVTGVDTAIPVPAGGSVTSVTISGNGTYAAFDWIPADGSASQIFRVAL
jgi:Tol biopolymer transport system component